jgi:hypothetical protein
MFPDQRLLRLLATLVVGAMLCVVQPQAALAAQWGSSYGDPPGFCPAQSRLPRTYALLPMTNDPTVADNPEATTFFGYHPVPGWDDWFGYWYGDFRGRPGDASGWKLIAHVQYPQKARWNFGDWGWAVHGHAKQYIAYYNPTFGGQCGMGWWGSPSPAPYMADVDGWPVVDIYVDAVPPQNPAPRITAITPGSISFSWDPVADIGDGAGADYVVAGMGGYASWLTINGGPNFGYQQSSSPLQVTATAKPGDTVCLFVVASDALQNATAPQETCGSPTGTPPVPAPPPPSGLAADPVPGLAGLPGWFWLQPAPAPLTTLESVGGVDYRVVAEPLSADWDFGDGARSVGGFGTAYPTPSPIQHAYDAQSAAGYHVTARVNYELSWFYRLGGGWIGPYPLTGQSVDSTPLDYRVVQAQAELMAPG